MFVRKNRKSAFRKRAVGSIKKKKKKKKRKDSKFSHFASDFLIKKKIVKNVCLRKYNHIIGPLVSAFRSPLMKAIDRSVETLGL